MLLFCLLQFRCFVVEPSHFCLIGSQAGMKHLDPGESGEVGHMRLVLLLALPCSTQGTDIVREELHEAYGAIRSI